MTLSQWQLFWNWLRLDLINAVLRKNGYKWRNYSIKSNNDKECITYHYWFNNHGFNFQHSICNGCHDLTMLSVTISDVAIITVTDVDYCRIVHDISKSDAIILLKNSVLDDCVTFEKLQFFAFGQNQRFYLTHSARKYFKKLA